MYKHIITVGNTCLINEVFNALIDHGSSAVLISAKYVRVRMLNDHCILLGSGTIVSEAKDWAQNLQQAGRHDSTKIIPKKELHFRVTDLQVEVHKLWPKFFTAFCK